MQLFHKIKIYKLTGKKFKATLPTTIELCIKKPNAESENNNLVMEHYYVASTT